MEARRIKAALMRLCQRILGFCHHMDEELKRREEEHPPPFCQRMR